MAPDFHIEHTSNKPVHCPYCQAEILAGEAVLACMDCESIYHGDCWSELNKCAMYGCESTDATIMSALPTVASGDQIEEDAGDQAFSFVQAAGGIQGTNQLDVGGDSENEPVVENEEVAELADINPFSWPPDISITLSDLATSSDLVTSADGPPQISIDDEELGPLTKCSYCHLEINAGVRAVTCRKCNTIHHFDCWNERRRCSVFGCNSRSHTGPNSAYPPTSRQPRPREQQKQFVFGIDTNELLDWWNKLKEWFRQVS